MESRSRKLVKLATSKLNDDNDYTKDCIAQNANNVSEYDFYNENYDYSNIQLTSIEQEISDQIEDTNNDVVSKQPHRDSSSSSSSSSSVSGSDSSSDSSDSSFSEDSDDSVKDPNYEIDPKEKADSIDIEDQETSTMQLSQIVVSSVEELQDCQVSDVNENPTIDNPLPIDDLSDPTPIGNKSTSVQNNTTQTDDQTKKGKKRQKNESNWKKNICKRARNTGKSYQSLKKVIPERQLKPPCKENCKFKCQSNFSHDDRQKIFNDYWQLGEIEKQWSFISNSLKSVVPKQRYVKIDSDGKLVAPRENNQAFYLCIGGVEKRVCKVFFKNTLAINNRPIETAIKKKNNNTNISSMKDNRGSHNNHKQVDESIKNDVKEFINNIPKIESHYIRANSRRHYIDGSKAVTDLHRDYVDKCKSENKPYANYLMFYRIFNQDFNISFFIPKKDLCDVCEAYKNCNDIEKEAQKQSYDSHILEKQLSRVEKENDKQNNNILVAVYDLEAVFQCPKGDISVFYYKSKLNVLNLTVYNIQTNSVECYVWDESNANRGVNEIGTCVYNYLKKVSQNTKDLEVVFYSDNCGGQQKNKFMIGMYMYAVQSLPNLKSVTHKFLIRGHTQNEGDSAHSQIEREIKRQLRSGPMYTPDAFIGAIKAARKKSSPMFVNEMCFDDFYDWKSLCNQINFTNMKDEQNNLVKISEIKMIKVVKDNDTIFFKKSYTDIEFLKAVITKKKKIIPILKKAFTDKPGLAEKKKKDLMELVNKNLIPRYHKPFYESL